MALIENESGSFKLTQYKDPVMLVMTSECPNGSYSFIHSSRQNSFTHLTSVMLWSNIFDQKWYDIIGYCISPIHMTLV